MGFMDTAREQAEATKRLEESRGHAGIEYRVDSMRESILGGKFSPDALQRLLNERAGHGWRLKSIVDAHVKGRVGPGGVGGLILIFERDADLPEPEPPQVSTSGDGRIRGPITD